MKRKLKVFLAEDNQSDVYLVKEALSLAGLACELAWEQNGEAAVKTLAKISHQDDVPDVVLIDLNLPKISGLDVLGIMRAQLLFANVPVVVLTSSDSPRDRAAVAERGAHYFRKPSDIHDFVRLGQIIKDLPSVADLIG
jgi:DNA-binding response OmpR family regulator